MKALIRRRWIDNVLDSIRFWIDTAPSLDYQPLPWFGIIKSKRSAGVLSRWKMIQRTINQMTIESALDIGCNAGFYSIRLSEMRVKVIGVESEQRYFRLCQYAIKKLNIKNFGLLYLEVDACSVSLLPNVDCTLFLSVFHHLTKKHGFEKASGVLKELWNKTNRILFFETGESEMGAKYKLPLMKPNPKIFLQNFLTTTCIGAEVLHLGLHNAFTADGTGVQRNLFAVVKR